MSNYTDTTAIINVIGNVFKNPSILDDDRYKFIEEYFPNNFHRILFGSIVNLHRLGTKEITVQAIDDYLSQRPKQYALYQSNKGGEYLQIISENADAATFPYYYSRLQKMTLLSVYHTQLHMDLSWLYDPDNILDPKKKQEQEDWLDNSTLEDIVNTIDNQIEMIKLSYVDKYDGKSEQAGEGLEELLQSFIDTPDYGYPMFGKYMNTITRGARLKKVYMRSAATGLGKTRTMMADACNFACSKIFNLNTRKWEYNGSKEPTLFISTEQEISELQTLALCFISGVNEEKILESKYTEDEYYRVKEACNVIRESPLYFQELPDFSLEDIENSIKRGIRDHGIKYICFDYIHSSMKILSEISSKAGVKGLREDNILFMIGVRLKDLANQYGVFIITATQLNGMYIDTKIYDQNLLRGAKSLGDKIDVGMIMLPVTSEDVEALQSVIIKNGMETPDMKISVYKNRRARYRDILIWCKTDRGTCRINPIFITDYSFQLMDIPDTQIEIDTTEKEEFK